MLVCFQGKQTQLHVVLKLNVVGFFVAKCDKCTDCHQSSFMQIPTSVISACSLCRLCCCISLHTSWWPWSFATSYAMTPSYTPGCFHNIMKTILHIDSYLVFEVHLCTSFQQHVDYVQITKLSGKKQGTPLDLYIKYYTYMLKSIIDVQHIPYQ